MSSGKPFPLNAWYPAAWGHEIGRELTARTICEKDLVLYRRADGAVAALEDACWHRLLPLSMGRLVGDQVVCGYHGLVFNSAGRCTHMPAQKTINPSACVRAYPVIERHRLIWIWPGDPALADPAEMPDFHWNDGEEWEGEGGTFRSLQMRLAPRRRQSDGPDPRDLRPRRKHRPRCDPRYAVRRDPYRAHGDHDALDDRHRPAAVLGPATGQAGPGRPLADRDLSRRRPWSSATSASRRPGPGAPQGDRSQGVNGAFLAAIAPETETSCHYFWNFVRTFRTDDEELTRRLQRAHVNDGKGVYDQDHVVLEAQQRAILKNPRLPFYNLNIDAGALWARRMIDRRLAKRAGRRLGPQAAE